MLKSLNSSVSDNRICSEGFAFIVMLDPERDRCRIPISFNGASTDRIRLSLQRWTDSLLRNWCFYFYQQCGMWRVVRSTEVRWVALYDLQVMRPGRLGIEPNLLETMPPIINGFNEKTYSWYNNINICIVLIQFESVDFYQRSDDVNRMYWESM